MLSSTKKLIDKGTRIFWMPLDLKGQLYIRPLRFLYLNVILGILSIYNSILDLYEQIELSAFFG